MKFLHLSLEKTNFMNKKYSQDKINKTTIPNLLFSPKKSQIIFVILKKKNFFKNNSNKPIIKIVKNKQKSLINSIKFYPHYFSLLKPLIIIFLNLHVALINSIF